MVPTGRLLSFALISLALIVVPGPNADPARRLPGRRAWLGRSPRRLGLIGGTGGLMMTGIGASLAITGRRD